MKKKKENKEKKLFLNKEKLRLFGRYAGRTGGTKCNSLRCIECSDKMRLTNENADLKRRLEELEENPKPSPVRKSTILKCHFQ